MKPLGEPNLRRRLDPEVLVARQRAAAFTGPWYARNYTIESQTGRFVGEAADAETAQHIVDCHNYFLTLVNMLLFRQQSDEDLNEPNTAASTLPRVAGSRRFPVPPSRPRSAGTP